MIDAPEPAWPDDMSPVYILPFPESVEERVARPGGRYAHENFPESRYAVDFLLDVDTPILCAREGTVVMTKDDSDRWGLDVALAHEANYVVVDHGDGTYAEYIHLGKDAVEVEKGQYVGAGDLLGYTGLSGCMSHPHLHFNAFEIEDGRGISIPAEFDLSDRD